MFIRVFLSLALLVAMPAWSQVDTDATESDIGAADQAQMLTPPPVNGEAYPTAVGSAMRSNYLRTGLIFNTAYSDNMFEDTNSNPVSDVGYSFWPTIAIDKATSRLDLTLNYSPGFTIYQRTAGRDQADQNVALDFSFRLSPHVTVSFQDYLLKTSNVLSQPDALSSEPISGSGQAPSIAFIAPIADQLSNTANTEITYQFSRNSMIGAAGTFTNLDYPNPAEVPGLYDSSSSGGSAFYSHRLAGHQYVGVTYRYSQILAYPVNAPTETLQTQTASLFYTIYLKPRLSLSFSGGPQSINVAQIPWPTYRSRTPAATASIGWQERHTNLTASYLRLVTGGAGLVGAFQLNSAAISESWQIAHAWSVGAMESYAIYKSVVPSYFLSTPGGHIFAGTISLQHPIGERLKAELGYTRLNQNFGGIELISNAPNADREFISISYQLAKPLGR